MKKFKIGDRLISGDAAPYVIAEMSANHNGNLMAVIIDAAKEQVRML